MIINGQSYKLHSKPAAGWIRRVVVQMDTQVPNFREGNVLTKVEYSRLGCMSPDTAPLWMTEPKALRSGVYLPRTLVEDAPSEVPVRVMNISGRAAEEVIVNSVSTGNTKSDLALEEVIELIFDIKLKL